MFHAFNIKDNQEEVDTLLGYMFQVWEEYGSCRLTQAIGLYPEGGSPSRQRCARIACQVAGTDYEFNGYKLVNFTGTTSLRSEGYKFTKVVSLGAKKKPATYGTEPGHSDYAWYMSH